VAARTGGARFAQQLARAGHEVHVYEKNAKPGGLLRYGIPDFRWKTRDRPPHIVQMQAEGVHFQMA